MLRSMSEFLMLATRRSPIQWMVGFQSSNGENGARGAAAVDARLPSPLRSETAPARRGTRWSERLADCPEGNATSQRLP
jgi:hypothetical protein